MGNGESGVFEAAPADSLFPFLHFRARQAAFFSIALAFSKASSMPPTM
jgi:hypothetical protein